MYLFILITKKKNVFVYLIELNSTVIICTCKYKFCFLLFNIILWSKELFNLSTCAYDVNNLLPVQIGHVNNIF